MRKRPFLSMIVAVCALAFVAGPRQAAALTDAQAQARTVADIQAVGEAMFNWLVDQAFLAPPGGSPLRALASTVDLSLYPSISHGDLESRLVPVYIDSVPELDGWGHPYDYRLNTANPLSAHVMAIRSAGKDETVSGDVYTVGTFESDRFDEDLVWVDGAFVRSPAETASLSFYTLPPCRVIDTRLTSALQSGVARTFDLGDQCDIPISAKAVVVNVTVIAATGAGRVTLFPAGLAVPATSTINFVAVQSRANSAIVPLAGPLASIEALAVLGNGGQVHLILDVSGVFE